MGEKEVSAKKKKKRRIFKTLNKKQKIGLGTTSIIAIAGLVTGIFFFLELEEPEEFIFKCGLNDAPDSIDPLKNPGPRYANLIIFDQIAEGLFAYDQNKTNTPIIPNLALDGNWSTDHLNFTCTLRTNVRFHDGTPFNAAAVKWNFDRIYRFIEIMQYSDTWVWYYMYLNSEGKPIINRTEIINDHIIRFVLNQPYVPIRDLFALWTSYILSPTSTPEDDFIDIRTGKLVGTGPFIFDSCEVDLYGEGLKTDMHANPDYWGGTPSINKVSFLALYSGTERMERMLSGELSYAMGSRNDYRLDIYRNTTGITVVSKTKLNIFYLSMNNNKINATMRRAISYAFNYTRFLEESFLGGHAERARSPLSNRMRYSNWDDFDIPDYNITRARQILIDANWSGTIGLTANDNITTGNEWEMIANSPTPLGTYNFSTCWPWMEFVANLTIGDLKQIGVKVNILKMGSIEFFDKGYEGTHDIFPTGWGVTGTDPVDVINALYSSKVDGTEGNWCNFNDTDVQQWMEQALEEFNKTKREQLYFNIQQRLIEQLNPHVWLAHPIDYDIWDSDVKGIPIDGAPLRLILKFCYLT